MQQPVETENQIDLSKDNEFTAIANAVIPLLQLPANQALKPALWSDLLAAIDDAIKLDKFIGKEEFEIEDHELFNVIFHFESPEEPNVLHMARVIMAILRDENKVVIKRGQLSVQITAQSLGETSRSELEGFRAKGMMERYKHRGDKMFDKLCWSAIDLRCMDSAFKHLMLEINDHVIRVDGEETRAPFYILNKDNNPIASIAAFKTQNSTYAMVASCNMSAKSGEALLETEVRAVAGISIVPGTNEKSGIYNLHTTSQIVHTLSADVSNSNTETNEKV